MGPLRPSVQDRVGENGCLVVVGLALAGATVGGTVGAVTGTISGALAGGFKLPDDVAAAVKQSGVKDLLLRQVQEAVTGVEPFQFSVISYPEQLDAPTLTKTYTQLSVQGIDSVIEMALINMAFVGTETTGPLHLVISIAVRVVRTSDTKVIARRLWEYDSDDYAHRYTLTEWQADDGRLLGNELEYFGKLLGSHVKTEFVPSH